MIPEIDPVSLRAELDGPNPPRLLDVREADELEICKLDDIVHIPIGEIPSRLNELDKDAEWVVVCHGGTRSGKVTAFLQQQGFENVRNLAGGMTDYSRKVDPTIPVY